MKSKRLKSGQTESVRKQMRKLYIFLFGLAFFHGGMAMAADIVREEEKAVRIAQGKIAAGEGRAALRLLLPLARQGDADAAYWLGRLYFYDVAGIPRSWPEARRWFGKAARAGHADAQYKLGGMYFAGRGAPPNPRKAAYWWLQAALQRQPEALNNLGALLATGTGVAPDPELALALQIVAARSGSEAAEENVRNKSAEGKLDVESAQRLADAFSIRHEALAERLGSLLSAHRP